MENCKLFAELVKATLDLERKVEELTLRLNAEKIENDTLKDLVENYLSKSGVYEKIGDLNDKVENLDQYIDDAKDSIRDLEGKFEDMESTVEELEEKEIDTESIAEEVLEKIDYDEIQENVIREIKARL